MTTRSEPDKRSGSAKRAAVSQSVYDGSRSSGCDFSEQAMRLQKTAGNRAVLGMLQSGRLQTKLQVGQPDDIYEREADRVAGDVLRMPDPIVQTKPG